MDSYWILGAGRFGSLAVGRLLEQEQGCSLLLVDRDRAKLRALEAQGVVTIQQDAIDFLLSHPARGPEWIVPAVPVHVAFRWLCRQLASEADVEQSPVPEAVDPLVPNPLRDGKGGLYTSFATFRCPDNCEEPADTCTVTGRPRATNLFDVLRRLDLAGFKVHVVRSRQLAPGVGGYRFSALGRLLQEGRRSPETPLLVATACRCHGVVHALRWKGR
jgi:hypothetical protein